MGIYFNNAATSYPKPDVVCGEMIKFMKNAATPGRGSAGEKEISAMRLVFECRENIAGFFSGKNAKKMTDPRFVTFTSNATESLNIVLKGFFSNYLKSKKTGMRILTSGMEHNAVIRPLRRLEALGAEIGVAECSEGGELYPETVEKMMKARKYDLMVMSHASNVCGTVQDIAAISSICASAGVPLVIDAAQTAGVIPIDVNSLGLAALCFTGHKGLMGPQGTGGIIWGTVPGEGEKEKFSSKVDPLIEGGTGSFSHMETQSGEMPDKFEAGTPNLPGIAGLDAAIKWINETGMGKIAAHENELSALLLSELASMSKKTPLRIYGKRDMIGRLPVFSFNAVKRGGFYDNGMLAGKLS
ncbi:MAG: aminotransferase class V-fold PLP-dependent enzyme, partial [Synergistaceae bacterium]|nr:aminotransferase class V-fold PLP-dependent enzyme [Synergistaceae bacterium]